MMGGDDLEWMNTDAWEADPENLRALEAEVPALAVLRQFAHETAHARWFASLGEPLDAETHELANLYLAGLGFPDADVAILPDWDDVVDVAQSLDLNSEAWEAEEQFRAALTEAALDLVSPEGLQVVLTYLAAQLAIPLRESAEEALSLSDENVDALVELLVGAGQQAAYGALLALAAAQAEAAQEGGEVDMVELACHPIFVKYRLFAIGRWPVSLTGRSFNLF